MINFSLEKFHSSDATEAFRVKSSDNVLTKSRKLETKSSWIIRFRSFLNLKKPKNQGARISISPYYLYTDFAALMSCNYDMCSQLVMRDSRSVGAPNGRGPRFLEPAEPAIATPLLIGLLKECANLLVPTIGLTKIINLYIRQPVRFPCNSKIQSFNHFSKSHPLTRNSSQITVQSRIYLSYQNCRNESSSPVSKAISPQTIS